LYKVLLVDDEDIIIKSISDLIDWNKYDMSLIGAAHNGLQAYEFIVKEKPDIVLTDIKMPGMSGLDLIAKVKEIMPDVIFVILSGYGEFEFASKAIEYGVKHYLLKPCDEEEIIPVLTKIIHELKQKDKKETFLKEIKNNLQKILPQVKEQFLRDFALTGIYNRHDCEFFLKLFNISDDRFKLVLFKSNKEWDFLEKFALKNIAEELLITERVYLSTIVEENVLFLIQPVQNVELNTILEEIKKAFYLYYNIDVSIAISSENSFNNIPTMYLETLECLKYAFYLGECTIITEDDINSIKGSENDSFNFDYRNIGFSVKSGNMENMKYELDSFFAEISKIKRDIHSVRSYCMELFLTIARQSSHDITEKYIDKIVKIHKMNTLKLIQEFITKTAYEITQKNFDNTSKNHSIIVESMIKCVNENIQNPDLTLSWVAKDVIFMNENYLGKLFLKETKEKFSQYVIRVRMEKAKELLESPKEYKIYEICQKTGFSDYTQYFSQVFKKYTGYTPTEYKKM